MIRSLCYPATVILGGTLLTAAEPAKDPAQAPPRSSTQDLVTHLLNEDLGTRKFLFADVVLAGSGKKVLPFDTAKTSHKEFLTAVSKAADDAMRVMNADDSPVRNLRRINEASRYFEDHLRKSLQANPSLTCTVPKNTRGKEQRSGYPDLLITHTAADGQKTRFYLDPKLFEKKSRASSLRTFYYEPRTRTNKIQHDATHILLGISHDGNDGKWQFTGWELCDLSKFQVRLKAEFQASNRDLYRPNIIIKSSDKP